MERSFIGVVLLLILRQRVLALTWYAHGLSLDINTTILIFLLLGLVLQGSPIAYANAIREAAKQTGFDAAAISDLWRHHGHHVRHRAWPRVIAKGFVVIADRL